MSCASLLTTRSLAIQYGVVDISSIILCTFTLICMCQIVKHKSESNAKGSNLFKYLLVKSVAELSVFLIDVFFVRYHTVPTMWRSLQSNIWLYYFQYYGIQSLLYVSSLMEIASTLDCLLSVWNKFKILISPKAFYVVTAIVLVLSFGYNMFILFIFYLYSGSYSYQEGNTTVDVSYFWRSRTDFGRSQDSRNFQAAGVVIRDIVFLAILMILNGLILNEMKKVTMRRKNMTKSHGQNNNQQANTVAASVQTTSRAVQAALNAERKKCYMMVASGSMYFFGHITSAIFQMVFMVSPGTAIKWQWQCVYYMGNNFLMISYGYSFFVYYFFNTHFKKFANDDMLLLISPILQLLKLCGLDLTKKQESNKSNGGGESTVGGSIAFTAAIH